MSIANVRMKMNVKSPAKFSGTGNLLMQNVYQKLPGHSVKSGKRSYSNRLEKLATVSGDSRNSINGVLLPIKNFAKCGIQAINSLTFKKPKTPMETFITKRFNTSASSSSASLVSRNIASKLMQPRVTEASLQKELFEKYRRNVEPQLKANSQWARLKLGEQKPKQGIYHKLGNQVTMKNQSRTQSQMTTAAAPILSGGFKNSKWPPMTPFKLQSQTSIQSKSKSTSVKANFGKSSLKTESKTKSSAPRSQFPAFLHNQMKYEADAEAEVQIKKRILSSVEKRDTYHNYSDSDPHRVTFKNNLMDFNKAVKNLISLGPRRNINFQPRLTSVSDPLLGWKHPTKLDILTIPEDYERVSAKDRHLAQAMTRKPKPVQIRLDSKKDRSVLSSLEGSKWYSMNRSKSFDVTDRSEVAKQQNKYIQQGALYNLTTKPNELADDTSNMESEEKMEHGNHLTQSIEPLSEKSPRKQQTSNQNLASGISRPQTATQFGESSCSFLAKSLKANGRYTDDFNDSNSVLRNEMHRKRHTQRKIFYNKSSHPNFLMNLHESPYVFKIDNDGQTTSTKHVKQEELKVKPVEEENRLEPETEPKAKPKTFRTDLDMNVNLKCPEGTTLEEIVKKSNQSQPFLRSPRKY